MKYYEDQEVSRNLLRTSVVAGFYYDFVELRSRFIFSLAARGGAPAAGIASIAPFSVEKSHVTL